jgi:predicted nucleic-acid-binding protein
MITIDTNVLVRILVDDLQQPQQTQKARALVQENKPVYLTQIVQTECIWVLKRIYKQDKNALLKVLEHFHENPDFILQHPDIFENAVELFRRDPVDFSDCLILAESLDKKSILYTFDKKLAQSNLQVSMIC